MVGKVGYVGVAETERVPGGDFGVKLFHCVPPGERKGSEERLSPATFAEPDLQGTQLDPARQLTATAARFRKWLRRNRALTS